ncbi:50S ribosomal protein L6 [Candidatus Woesebacteria bacterium RIFOXYA1_FULL_43_9]|uniref:50S ribosomal protein L6 n=1 Tax=Candidatus Woesebacteria bacterium RIFOXYA1_FULL_43_9 TaxID=1802534 RepID=A0A1F8CLL8_9BACT|nr:MAG: 50S ribosomal protein L6 [Candidatus Woesebacteria bacterium RIFOXYA1_FULL_43_9]
MSRIGRLPITLKEGVVATQADSQVVFKGPKGELALSLPKGLSLKIEGDVLTLSNDKGPVLDPLYGTTRALLANAAVGVVDGYTKQLEVVGTGFRVEVGGAGELVMTLGFSHPVKIVPPAGVTFKTEKMVVTVSGIDRGLVGQTAANVRKVKPAEPYKGKGVMYVGEVIRRKAGKAAKTAA